MSLVVDASMAVAWLFHDEGTEKTKAILHDVMREGAVVPSLCHLDVADVLRSAVRRNRSDQAYADRCIARLERLPFTVDLETNIRAWGDTRALAVTSGLTLYDAASLELAIRLGYPLATTDRDLIAAVPSYNVQVLVP